MTQDICDTYECRYVIPVIVFRTDLHPTVLDVGKYVSETVPFLPKPLNCAVLFRDRRGIYPFGHVRDEKH